MAVNLDSMFLVTRAMIPLLRSDAGRIIDVASLAGRNGGHPGATAYAASKAGIFGFRRGLAKELANRGITVNALAPGFIDDTLFHAEFTTEESKTRRFRRFRRAALVCPTTLRRRPHGFRRMPHRSGPAP